MTTPAPEAAALEQMEGARASTLNLVSELSDGELRAWPDPEFSPVGWHLGHVAFTEAMWIAHRLGGDDSLHSPFARDFAQNGRPKAERSDLPERTALLAYLDRVRGRSREVAGEVLDRRHPLLAHGFVWWFIAAHEHQHRETMAFVLAQHRARSEERPSPTRLDALSDEGAPPAVTVPAGEVTIGTDHPFAYDNERPAQVVEVRSFRLDAHPVTCAAWARFMGAGGYEDRRLWSQAGWAWRTRTGVRAPFGWTEVDPGRWVGCRLTGPAPLDGREPVWGVSHHEAEAFARWRGARLPTETEWEHACRHFEAEPQRCALSSDGPAPVHPGTAAPTDLLGQVWEWTSSWFEPRPGFEPFPYRGYSEPYFGATHRVLKGGSFATHPAIARSSFRNWYMPHIRQIFAGLRCASDGANRD